jgi:hypothetical protein
MSWAQSNSSQPCLTTFEALLAQGLTDGFSGPGWGLTAAQDACIKQTDNIDQRESL